MIPFPFGWIILAAIVGLFVAAGARDAWNGRQEDRRQRQGEVLAARGHLVDAAEEVILIADELCVGMPLELRGAIERLRAAVAREGKRQGRSA
jgi:hypothetical protein